jgi:hypothetical protein
MKNKNLLFAIVLFVLGMAGVLSILTVDLPLPEEAKALLEDMFTPVQIKLITLVNPTVMLIIAIIIGVLLQKKTALGAPIIEFHIGKTETRPDYRNIFIYGMGGGVIAGGLISLISLLFEPHLPGEFIELGEKLKPTLAARFLYGGITEEILMRFGLMTLFVWLAAKVFRGGGPAAYWTGIALAALLFAVGHFPVAFSIVDAPTPALLTYILTGNAAGGLIFGWLYWKRGLESAFLAHIFAHVVMVLAQ